MHKFYASILFLLILIHTPAITKATIINVPSGQATIQAAINISVNGDTVLVEPGIYYENINFRGKLILLTSRYYLSGDTSFICSTIINGSQPAFPDTASCIIFNSDEDSTAIVQGFTITGGAGTKWLDVHGAGTFREGGGILAELASPTIRYNYIFNNVVTNTSGVASTGGGGMRCGDGSPIIFGNYIAYNTARYGGGVVFNYCDNAVLKNNVIVHNSGGQSFGGGGVWATGTGISSVLYVENNTIANNHVTGAGSYGGKGGGIFVFSVTIEVTNNIIWHNTQVSGNTIAAYSGGVVHVNYSDVDMTAAGNGNINSDPLFMDTISYLLSSGSPCIDAGDSSSIFEDLISAPNVAMYPSNGTERNDMGAYGGQKAVTIPVCELINGINNQKREENMMVYPVPASDVICVKNKTVISKIEIYELSGQKVINQICLDKNVDLNISSLRQGTYILKVIAGKKINYSLIEKINQ